MKRNVDIGEGPRSNVKKQNNEGTSPLNARTGKASKSLKLNAKKSARIRLRKARQSSQCLGNSTGKDSGWPDEKETTKEHH